MRRKDDSTLPAADRRRVITEARRALERAGAVGVFPTPVEAIMKAARVQEAPEDVIGEGLLSKLRGKAGEKLRSALSKVIGVFDAVSRMIFVDGSLYATKKVFVKLHETAHGFLPWQRELYAVVEESHATIAPDVADQFDREANVFAAEVLFQLDGFSREADEQEFNIFVPVSLAKKFGASNYASIRRYVEGNNRCCAVIVLDPPVACEQRGFRCNVRRVVSSPTYATQFDDAAWPEYVSPDDAVGALVPQGKRRASGKRPIGVVDRNGKTRSCTAEAFSTGHHIFVLVHASERVSATVVAVPG